jgi:tRNA/rRNA methyltransferase
MRLGNIRIVLVRPRGAANVGAVARAMKNMGLRDLVLVQPALGHSFWTRAMAVHADDVLQRVRRVDSLAAAVADCGLVVGTTCRDGLYRAGAEPPRSAAPRIVAAAASNVVGVVFGPEDHGLSNEDLKACHQLIAIPTDPAYPSLNLAQAVMVCCYELFLAAQRDGVTAPVAAPLASARRVDFMLQRLQAAFLSVGFLHPDNPDHIMFAFRRMLGRVQLEERDVRILLALARQIEWFGRGGWEVVAARESALRDGPEKTGPPQGERKRLLETMNRTVRPEEPPSFGRRLEGRAPRT